MSHCPLLYIQDDTLRPIIKNCLFATGTKSPIEIQHSNLNPDFWASNGSEFAILELNKNNEFQYQKIVHVLKSFTSISFITILDIRNTSRVMQALGAGSSGLLNANPQTLIPQLKLISGLGHNPTLPKELEPDQVPGKYQLTVLNSGLFVRKNQSLIKVKFEDLFWIRGLGNYATLHTRKEKLVVAYTLKKLIDLLPKQLFARVHRSYIINLDRISSINQQGIYIGENEIPVSKAYRKFMMDSIFVV